MNYTQMFANGGKTSDQELIKGIQKILGVDDSQMEQLLQIGINKYGSLEGIGQALSQATQGLTQNSSPEEVQAAVASVFQTNAESQMFKCGGKLQQLVSKFGKGGNVDCGCNGVKLGQEGFKTSGSGTDPDAGFHTWDIEVTPQKDTIVRYTYPSYNGKAVLTPNGGTVKEWLNGDSFPIVYHDRNWFNRHPRRALLPFIGNLNDAKIINARELAQNHIPSQQEGGVMLEQTPGNPMDASLTRRQARELSQLNKGYNRAQFQTAMLNAKTSLRNQGLRGRELRERAREMAAGISPAERSIVNVPTQLNVTAPVLSTPAAITAPEQITLPETQVLLDQMLDNTNKKPTRSLNKPTSSKKGVIEVGDVSVIGTTSKSNVKALWGEMPLVSTMFPNQKTNEQIQQEKRDRKAGEYERYMNTTGANEDVAAWGFDPYFKNINRTSDAYRQGQKQAAKNTAITTVAGTAAALGVPAAIQHAPAAGRFVVNALKPSPRLLTAEQVQTGWNGGLGAMRDGLLLRKCGGKVKSKEGIKLAKCGGKSKKKK